MFFLACEGGGGGMGLTRNSLFPCMDSCARIDFPPASARPRASRASSRLQRVKSLIPLSLSAVMAASSIPPELKIAAAGRGGEQSTLAGADVLRAPVPLCHENVHRPKKNGAIARALVFSSSFRASFFKNVIQAYCSCA